MGLVPMLDMVVAPRKSWLPGGSGGKNILITVVTAAHPPELWTGEHTSPVAYSSVLDSMERNIKWHRVQSKKGEGDIIHSSVQK